MFTPTVLTTVAVAEVPILSHADVVNARRRGRSMAAAAHFGPAEATVVAAAISELARNIVVHAKRGEIALQLVEKGDRLGFRIVASDRGPGIANPEHAMGLDDSSPGSPGLGLPAVKQVMDEFHIDSHPASGTRVVVTKWRS
jgi:serine/threonine-protein kinase RsbT